MEKNIEKSKVSIKQEVNDFRNIHNDIVDLYHKQHEERKELLNKHNKVYLYIYIYIIQDTNIAFNDIRNLKEDLETTSKAKQLQVSIEINKQKDVVLQLLGTVADNMYYWDLPDKYVFQCGEFSGSSASQMSQIARIITLSQDYLTNYIVYIFVIYYYLF